MDFRQIFYRTCAKNIALKKMNKTEDTVYVRLNKKITKYSRKNKVKQDSGGGRYTH